MRIKTWKWREEDQVLVLVTDTGDVNVTLEFLVDILVTLPSKMAHQALYELYNAISERDTILARWKEL